jgi:hypothetical protein
MVRVSSSWDSRSLFAPDDSNSNFCVPESFQTPFSRFLNIRNARFIPIKFFLTEEN